LVAKTLLNNSLPCSLCLVHDVKQYHFQAFFERTLDIILDIQPINVQVYICPTPEVGVIYTFNNLIFNDN